MKQISVLLGAVLLVVLIFGSEQLPAQTCWVTASSLNRDRLVSGPVNAECGWEDYGCWHSPPFGNWGVTSNFGDKYDGDQFQGWHPSDSKLQWNSCTADYPPGMYGYYNWNADTEQFSGSVNQYGGKLFDMRVSCPRDEDGDRACDTGGCKDLLIWAEGTNWMTLYELDPPVPPWCGTDDLVESLYFPPMQVDLDCETGWCDTVGTEWLDPTSGSVTDAQIKMEVSAWYEDGQECENLRAAGYMEYMCY